MEFSMEKMASGREFKMADAEWRGCDISSTMDHMVGAIKSDSAASGTVVVIMSAGVSVAALQKWCTAHAGPGGGPDLIVDDGGDATVPIRKGVKLASAEDGMLLVLIDPSMKYVPTEDLKMFVDMDLETWKGVYPDTDLKMADGMKYVPKYLPTEYLKMYLKMFVDMDLETWKGVYPDPDLKMADGMKYVPKYLPTEYLKMYLKMFVDMDLETWKGVYPDPDLKMADGMKYVPKYLPTEYLKMYLKMFVDMDLETWKGVYPDPDLGIIIIIIIIIIINVPAGPYKPAHYCY